MCNCSSFRGNCVTHARTHTHGANYNLPPASDNIGIFSFPLKYRMWAWNTGEYRKIQEYFDAMFTAVPSLAGFRRAIRMLLLGRCRFDRRWLFSVYPSHQSHLCWVHESGGSTTGSFCFLLLSTFFPGLVSRVGQLLKLRRRKRLINLAIKLQNTGIVSHPLLPTSGTFLVTVELGHNVPASSSFLSRGRHNDDRTRRSKEINLVKIGEIRW